MECISVCITESADGCTDVERVDSLQIRCRCDTCPRDIVYCQHISLKLVESRTLAYCTLAGTLQTGQGGAQLHGEKRVRWIGSCQQVACSRRSLEAQIPLRSRVFLVRGWGAARTERRGGNSNSVDVVGMECVA